MSAHDFLVGWLIACGLIVAYRGLAGTTRTYTVLDAVFGVAEIAFILWLLDKAVSG